MIVKACREMIFTIIKTCEMVIVKDSMNVNNLFVIKNRMHKLDIKQCTVNLFIKKIVKERGTLKIWLRWSSVEVQPRRSISSCMSMKGSLRTSR